MWELKYGNLGLLEILNCVSPDQNCGRDWDSLKLKCKQQPYPLKLCDKENCSQICSPFSTSKETFKVYRNTQMLSTRLCRIVLYELRERVWQKLDLSWFADCSRIPPLPTFYHSIINQTNITNNIKLVDIEYAYCQYFEDNLSIRN